MLRWFETRIDPFRSPPAKDPPPRVLGFYWYFIRQAPLPIVALMLASGLSIVLEIVVFIYLGQAVDIISGGRSGEELSRLISPLIVLIPLTLLLELVAAYFQALISNQTIFGTYHNLIRWQSHLRVIRRRLSFFQNEQSGRIATHVHETGNTIVNSVVGAIHSIWSIFILIGTAAIVFFSLYWVFLLPLLIWLGGFIAVAVFLAPRTRKAAEAQFEQRSQLAGTFVDTYANIVAVKLFGAIDREDAQIRSNIGEFLVTVRRMMRLSTLQNASVLTLNTVLIGAVFIIALLASVEGLIPVGNIVVATALVLRLQTYSFAIVGGIAGLANSIGTVENGMKSIAPKAPDRPSPPLSGIPITAGAVSFRNVVFGYPGGERVLDGLSFEVGARRSLGIVGLSGAGKTTILNLLAGLYAPESGSISIDGRDISSIADTELWDGLSVVTQDPSLFNRSIRDNVRFGRAEATDEEVNAALAKASAADFVAKLADTEGRRGLEAHVGERGVKLSGGQRQRIAIARALLKDAPILVFDEPTSALDSETEAAIQKTLTELKKTKTLLVIAHRVSTIANLDRVIVLDRGKVVETGSHNELVKLGGIYHGFWRLQSEAGGKSMTADAAE